MALLDRAYGALTQLGYSPAQAAGILGNLKTESGLNPSAVGDGGTSYGLAQWHNDRWAGLKNYAASHGMSQADPVAQINYLDWELKNKEPRAYKALQSAGTPQDAAAAFLHFERPQGYTADNPLASMGAQKRVQAAVGLYNSLSGQEPIPGSAPVLGASFHPSAIPAAPDLAPPISEPEIALPAQDQPAARGLLARLMPQDAPQAAAAPQPDMPDAPSIKRGRGLAFRQMTVKTPSFRRR